MAELNRMDVSLDADDQRARQIADKGFEDGTGCNLAELHGFYSATEGIDPDKLAFPQTYDEVAAEEFAVEQATVVAAIEDWRS